MVSQDTQRRDVLRGAGLLGAAALAGCTGGNESGSSETDDGQTDSTGGGDTGGTGGDGDATDTAAPTETVGTGKPGSCTPGHTNGDPPCEQIADDAAALVRFDAAGTDLLVSFAYPCGWQTGTTDQFDDRYQANASRFGIGSGDEKTTVDMQVRVTRQPVADDYVQSQTADGNFEAVDYEYDGETRTGQVADQSGDFDTRYGATAYAAIPYEGSLYGVELVPTLQGDACGVEVDALVVDMLQSLEPNPETSFTPS